MGATNEVKDEKDHGIDIIDVEAMKGKRTPAPTPVFRSTPGIDFPFPSTYPKIPQDEESEKLKPTPTFYVLNLILAVVSCLCGCVLIAMPAIYYSKKAVKLYPYDHEKAKKHMMKGLFLWIISFVSSLVLSCVFLIWYINKYDPLKVVPPHERLGGWDSQ